MIARSGGENDSAECSGKLERKYPIPCFSPISSSSSRSVLPPSRRPRGRRGTYFPSTPSPWINRQEESLAFSSRLVSTTFLPIARLALVNSSVTHLTPSPRNRPFIHATTWSPCGRIHAPFPVRLPCAFIEIPPRHVFIEHPRPVPFPAKNLKPDVPPTLRLRVPSTQITRNPCPCCLPQVIFGPRSYSQSACTPSPLSPSNPHPILLSPFTRHRRLTCYRTA